MYYHDLSSYTNMINAREPLVVDAPQALSVGWLETGHSYTQGEITGEFMARLWTLGRAPVNLMRGFHECDFCSDPSFSYLNVHKGDEELGMGNGEIWVFGDDGKVYVAPTLIYHYITQHRYLPPEPFVRAVLEAPLPDTPEYDRLAGQFRWGKNMLREKEFERRHAQGNQ
jgi:hypothetical protein